MIGNNELLLGIGLITAGIVLAILAYAVLTGKPRGDEAPASAEALREEGVPSSREEAEGDFGDSARTEDIPPLSEADAQGTSAPQPSPGADAVSGEAPPSPSAEPESEAPEPEASAETPKPATDAAEDAAAEKPSREPLEESAEEPSAAEGGSPAPAAIQDRPRIQVASLLRDEVTGELIVGVGDEEFSSADELRQSKYWTRVEYAAADLSKWISVPQTPHQAPAAPSVEPSPKPASMIEQINEILQRKLSESEHHVKAVQLIEGPGGMARVLIGVHSYEIGEVPDEGVRALIKESVAAWEAEQ